MSKAIAISQKQYDVWTLLCHAFPLAEIASQLGVRRDTVSERLRRIRKMARADSNVALLGMKFAVAPAKPLPIHPLLTDRESEMVLLVAKGKLQRQIASEMGITINTVKRHMFNVYEKTGMSNKVELALWVMHQQKEKMKKPTITAADTRGDQTI